MKRYIIRQFLGAQKAKEPDIEIEGSNAVVEGKIYIIAHLIVEREGQQIQRQIKFDNESELQKVLQDKYIIEE